MLNRQDTGKNSRQLIRMRINFPGHLRNRFRKFRMLFVVFFYGFNCQLSRCCWWFELCYKTRVHLLHQLLALLFWSLFENESKWKKSKNSKQFIEWPNMTLLTLYPKIASGPEPEADSRAGYGQSARWSDWVSWLWGTQWHSLPVPGENVIPAILPWSN